MAAEFLVSISQLLRLPNPPEAEKAVSKKKERSAGFDNKNSSSFGRRDKYEQAVPGLFTTGTSFTR
jgi:hypothetical protein